MLKGLTLTLLQLLEILLNWYNLKFMAQTKEDNKKVLLILLGLTALGVAGYLLYRHYKKQPTVDAPTTSNTLKDVYDNLVFLTGTATIKPESFPSLDELSSVLKQSPIWKLTVIGHTDNTGSPNSNLLLSQKRADAVRNYLIQSGIEPSRIITQGKGQTEPIADNTTPEGREKNRRVEFSIIK